MPEAKKLKYFVNGNGMNPNRQIYGCVRSSTGEVIAKAPNVLRKKY